MFRIYYAIEPSFRDDPVHFEDLKKTHKFVGSFPGDKIEDAFMFFQGEMWSPHGEANELIRSLGLGHTSMSVGDVAIDDEGRAFQCMMSGWKRIDPILYEGDRNRDIEEMDRTLRQIDEGNRAFIDSMINSVKTKTDLAD